MPFSLILSLGPISVEVQSTVAPFWKASTCCNAVQCLMRVLAVWYLSASTRVSISAASGSLGRPATDLAEPATDLHALHVMGSAQALCSIPIRVAYSSKL